jgi:hypothetical protein
VLGVIRRAARSYRWVTVETVWLACAMSWDWDRHAPSRGRFETVLDQLERDGLVERRGDGVRLVVPARVEVGEISRPLLGDIPTWLRRRSRVSG